MREDTRPQTIDGSACDCSNCESGNRVADKFVIVNNDDTDPNADVTVTSPFIDDAAGTLTGTPNAALPNGTVFEISDGTNTYVFSLLYNVDAATVTRPTPRPTPATMWFCSPTASGNGDIHGRQRQFDHHRHQRRYV